MHARQDISNRCGQYNLWFCKLLDTTLNMAAREIMDWATMRKIEDVTIIDHVYFPCDENRVMDDYYETRHLPQNNERLPL